MCVPLRHDGKEKGCDTSWIVLRALDWKGMKITNHEEHTEGHGSGHHVDPRRKRKQNEEKKPKKKTKYVSPSICNFACLS